MFGRKLVIAKTLISYVCFLFLAKTNKNSEANATIVKRGNISTVTGGSRSWARRNVIGRGETGSRCQKEREDGHHSDWSSCDHLHSLFSVFKFTMNLNSPWYSCSFVNVFEGTLLEMLKEAKAEMLQRILRDMSWLMCVWNGGANTG